MALGATPQQTLTTVLRESLTLTGAGIVLGTIGAMAAARLLSSQLHNLSVYDYTTYAGVGVLLVSVMCVSCISPAWRAVRMDPLAALKEE